MKITIDYDSCWRNSFLDGSNNEKPPKGGRKFIGTLDGVKKNPSKIKLDITLNTVMGLLNRVIGDQRKLYQARSNAEDYFFSDIDYVGTDKVVFTDRATESTEMVYIRNVSTSVERASFIGSINADHPFLTSDYSPELWGVLDLSVSKLIHFLLNKDTLVPAAKSVDPRDISSKAGDFKDIKLDKIFEKEAVIEDDIIKAVKYLKEDVLVNSQLRELFPALQKSFSDIEYIAKEKAIIRALYCSSLYVQAIRLSERYDLTGLLLRGFSVNGFTLKGFMKPFTGGLKKAYGTPYALKEFGVLKPMLTKASGQLEINIDVSRKRADLIKTMIENAGVSSFYLGKKGLAFISKDIDTREFER